MGFQQSTISPACGGDLFSDSESGRCSWAWTEKKNCAAHIELVSQLYNVKTSWRVQIRREKKEGENLSHLQGKQCDFRQDQLFLCLIQAICGDPGEITKEGWILHRSQCCRSDGYVC